MRKLMILALSLAMIAAACGGGESGTAVPADEVTTTTAGEMALAVSDFTVRLVTIESQCFDSAGALVTVEPELYASDRALAMQDEVDQTYRVTYEVSPVEGGSNTYSIEVDTFTGKYSADSEHNLSTDSCSDQPRATVTSVKRLDG